MNEEFLVDQISMPAKTRRDVINACDLKVDLRGKDLVQLRTDLSSVRGPHVERIEDYLRDARRGAFQTVLFSGHIGSGKTTELRWLARRLQETREDRTFHVVWVDANEYLDIYSVQVPEVLLALVSAILDDAVLRPMIQVSTAAKKLWTTIVETLKPIGVELEASLPSSSGPIKAKIKKEPGFQKRAREALRERVAPIIELLSGVLVDVRAGLLKQGVDDVVLIVDNLEKVLFLDGSKPDEPNAHDLFFVEQLPVIEEIRAHVVVTVPVSMHFRHNRLRQVF